VEKEKKATEVKDVRMMKMEGQSNAGMRNLGEGRKCARARECMAR